MAYIIKLYRLFDLLKYYKEYCHISGIRKWLFLFQMRKQYY